MIAGIEKQKLVYVMNRDASSRLTISSPLEAHKSQVYTHVLYTSSDCSQHIYVLPYAA
jgi:splicing factor 3B subunit 3